MSPLSIVALTSLERLAPTNPHPSCSIGVSMTGLDWNEGWRVGGHGSAGVCWRAWVGGHWWAGMGGRVWVGGHGWVGWGWRSKATTVSFKHWTSPRVAPTDHTFDYKWAIHDIPQHPNIPFRPGLTFRIGRDMQNIIGPPVQQSKNIRQLCNPSTLGAFIVIGVQLVD